MADHLRLLLKAVPAEGAAFDEFVVVAAEGVPHQRQIEAAAGLRLPYMGHFMDEQPLEREALFREIIRPQRAIVMKVNIAGRSHDGSPGLEWPPSAADHPDAAVVDRITEN